MIQRKRRREWVEGRKDRGEREREMRQTDREVGREGREGESIRERERKRKQSAQEDRPFASASVRVKPPQKFRWK